LKEIIKRKCFISSCRKYRWALDLDISPENKEIIFIGLNPSLSNENFTDNTTKKIIKISENYKYGKVKIINLFGLISRCPQLLLRHKDPIGHLNNIFIHKSLRYWSKTSHCDLWLGWGNKGSIFDRNLNVIKILMEYFYFKETKFIKPRPPLFIRKTKNNNPIHPLYCPDNSELVEYI